MAGLRAVYDDGTKHSDGTVRAMWASGIVVATDARPPIGTPVAVIVLCGGFDDARLSAEIAGVENNGLMLRFIDLDSPRWTRLRSIVESKPLATAQALPVPSRAPPPNVPVFIISGGDEHDLGDPTGTFLLTEQKRRKSAEKQVPAPFQLPGNTDPFARVPPKPSASATADLEAQIAALSSKSVVLTAENQKLKTDVARLTALKGAVEEELRDAQKRIDDIEAILRRR